MTRKPMSITMRQMVVHQVQIEAIQCREQAVMLTVHFKLDTSCHA